MSWWGGGNVGCEATATWEKEYRTLVTWNVGCCTRRMELQRVVEDVTRDSEHVITELRVVLEEWEERGRESERRVAELEEELRREQEEREK
eukprot:3206676-Rhodomonas_salina.5